MPYDILRPIDAKDNMAQFFNLYMKGLSNMDLLAMPRDSMREILEDTDDPGREGRLYLAMSLNNSLHGLHSCMTSALAVLDHLFDKHEGDLTSYAVANRLEVINQYGSDDDSDWEPDGDGWKMTYKDDEESLKPYSVRAELADYFYQPVPDGGTRGEKIGSSLPEHFAYFTVQVRSQTDFCFSKMWGDFTGQELSQHQLQADGSFAPLSTADRIEREINEDIKNGAVADVFEQALNALQSVWVVFHHLPDSEILAYKTIQESLRYLLNGPGAGAAQEDGQAAA